ncbi:tetratricopeptide repeat protein [Gaopeijia maritima]|uniref:tetratricopeptide repeat protein n=1 Tax=Gaopeijia maritima TaxID=3119007 RepID=UPI00324B87A5
MNFRMGLILAGSLVFVGGCAASSGGGSAAAPSMPSAGGETLAQGERPRENDMTRSAEDHLEQGDAAATPEEAAQHYQLAAQEAQAAIDADPTNPLAHRLLAMAHIGTGDLIAADAAMDRAEELRPIYELETESIREQAWISQYQKATPFVESGDYAGAIELFEQADAIYEERPEVKIYLGQLYVQEEQYDEGIVVLREATDIINSDRIEMMDSATAASWREQEQQVPIFIAQALMQTQRYDEASTVLEELLAEDPGNMGYLRQLAALYVEMGQPEEAQGIYDRMTQAGDLSSDEWYAIGVGYYQMDDNVGAIEAFRTAAEMSVNNRDALEMWSRSVVEEYPAGGGEDAVQPPAGVLEGAQEAAERWLELDPANRFAHLILAQTANRLGNEDRARDLVAAVEALEVVVSNISMQRYPDGGGMVVGTLTNGSMEAGSNVTMNFQFYDASGSVIGSEQAMVVMPAVEGTQTFQVEFVSSQMVEGYGYTIGGM